MPHFQTQCAILDVTSMNTQGPREWQYPGGKKKACVDKQSYRVTNKEVRAKIQQAIEPHEGLLTVVKRRKLQWYGHVSCSSGLAKTTLQGTVQGGRR